MNADVLSKLESKFGLFQWRAKDILPWVIGRIHLSNRLVYWRQGAAIRAVKEPRSAKIGHVFAVPSLAAARTPTDVLFFSYGTYRSPIGGRTFDRLMDPLERLSQQAGLRTLSLQFSAGKPMSLPTAFPTIDVTGPLLRRRAFASLFPKMLPRFSGYDDFIKGAVAAGYESLAKRSDRLAIDVSTVEYYARFFAKVLRQSRPKAVFVGCYYSLPSLALTLAANRLGIISIDVQHGVQGEGHLCYAGLDNLPAGSCALLPKKFAVWGPTEAATINEWALKRGHQALALGNLWQRSWQAGDYDAELAKERDEVLVEGRKRLAKGRNHVLVTLQRGYPQYGLTTPLIKLMREASNVTWWVRAHPSMMGQLESVDNELADLGLTQTNLNAASRLPLPSLLAKVRIHLTASSSVILEAKLWQIPSISVVQPPDGYYIEEIASQWLYVAEDYQTLHDLFGQLERRESNKIQDAAKADLKHASQLLLDLCKPLSGSESR